MYIFILVDDVSKSIVKQPLLKNQCSIYKLQNSIYILIT